jgi:hypothetical protein
MIRCDAEGLLSNNARVMWAVGLLVAGLGCSEGSDDPVEAGAPGAEAGAPGVDAGAPGADAPMSGGSFSGPPQQPTPAERPMVRIRVVNLYSAGEGQPGPSVDVYRTGELHARQREARPIVAALEYGKASEWFSPVNSLLQPGDLGDTVMFFDAGARMLNAGTFGGFMLRENLRDGDKVTILVHPARQQLGMRPPAFGIHWEARPAAAGSVPVAVADKALVIARDAAVVTYGSTYRFHLAVAGACQEGLDNPGNPGLFGTDGRFAFAPGTLSLTAHRFAEPASCAGAPAAGPASVEGTAGGRTWLWIHGPAMTDLRLLALPFGP